MHIVPAPNVGDGPVEAVLNPEGELYEYQMFFGNDVVFSDSITEMIAYLIPGYETGTEQEQAETAFEQRYMYAISVAAAVQGSVMAAAMEYVDADGVSDLDKATQEELDTLSQRKALPFATDDGEPFRWDNEIPLIVLDCDYEPNTDIPAPEGESVIFLRCVDEMEFLLSLADLGVILLASRED